jgi:hypothetical protein
MTRRSTSDPENDEMQCLCSRNADFGVAKAFGNRGMSGERPGSTREAGRGELSDAASNQE